MDTQGGERGSDEKENFSLQRKENENTGDSLSLLRSCAGLLLALSLWFCHVSELHGRKLLGYHLQRNHMGLS